MKKLLTLFLFALLIVTTNFATSPKQPDPFTSIFNQFQKLVEEQFKNMTDDDQKKLTAQNNTASENETTYQIIILDGAQTNLQQPPQTKQITIVPPANTQQQSLGQGLPQHIQNLNPQLQQLLIGNQTQPQPQQIVPRPQTNVTFKDVIGQKEALEEVTEIVDFLKDPEDFKKLGAEMPTGILLEGPPGNGKTLIARAIAGEADCNFIPAHGSQFINKYVGTGAAGIRELFDKARNMARETKKSTIVFIDELDAIGSRERDENQEYRHTVNELLNQMDGFEQDDNVVIVGATNYVKSIDRALLRPGRFDRIVKIALPTRDGRKQILQYYSKQKTLDPKLSLEQLTTDLAKRTTSFSAADLKKLANEAALAARREKTQTVQIQHFETAYDKIILGLKNTLERTKEQLEKTAHHEAGHTIVKLLTDQPVAKVTILSRGDTLGATYNKEKYETFSEYTKEELVNKIMALQGGFVAEKLIFNCERPGASNDLERINNLANSMIKEFGMGEGELRGITYSGMVSDSMKELFDQEVLKLIQTCKAKTEKLLANNKKLLCSLAKEILEKETLTEIEISEVTKIKLTEQQN
jgi:cell division protease FtsH